jgi:hypothetical protein
MENFHTARKCVETVPQYIRIVPFLHTAQITQSEFYYLNLLFAQMSRTGGNGKPPLREAEKQMDNRTQVFPQFLIFFHGTMDSLRGCTAVFYYKVVNFIILPEAL